MKSVNYFEVGPTFVSRVGRPSGSTINDMRCVGHTTEEGIFLMCHYGVGSSWLICLWPIQQSFFYVSACKVSILIRSSYPLDL